MPTTGAYEFRRAAIADPHGVIAVEQENKILPGEWAWVDRTQEWGDGEGSGFRRWLMIYARCPDCGMLATLWRLGSPPGHSHDLDAQGRLQPSVECPHETKTGKCGFHTHPTTLLHFFDLRTA